MPETEVSLAEEGLARLKIGLQRAGLGASNFPWPPPNDPDRAPYRGLKALKAQDAAVFFGREAAIVRGLDALRALRDQGVERKLVILGASGSGKSSFLRAGLWPRLERDYLNFLPLPVIRPERAVISGTSGLVACLESAFHERNLPKSRATIRTMLKESDGLARLLQELQELSRSRLTPETPKPTAVICVDQGEELSSTEGRAEVESFLGMLAETPGLQERTPHRQSKHADCISGHRNPLGCTNDCKLAQPAGYLSVPVRSGAHPPGRVQDHY